MKGYIYAIKNRNTEKCYIGSTEGDIRRRLSCHKSYYRHPDLKQYSSRLIFEFGVEDTYIQLIREVEVENKIELRKHERVEIELNPNAVNKNVPSQSVKEYQQKHPDIMKKAQKKYRTKNAEKFKEYYRKYNQEKRKEISEQKKQYYLKCKNERT